MQVWMLVYTKVSMEGTELNLVLVIRALNQMYCMQ